MECRQPKGVKPKLRGLKLRNGVFGHGALNPKDINQGNLYSINTLRTGLLNCLNARSRGLNNVIQLLYCVSLKIYNKFANYFCELNFSGNTHQRP